MNLDFRFRPGLGGHQVPKTACNTFLLQHEPRLYVPANFKPVLGGHQAPKQPAGPFAAVVVDGFVEVVPGTSGFGGDSDAVQGQVNEQLTPASRDSLLP